MDDFLKMDIFFVLATVMTLLIGILASVFLFYAIRVARTLHRLSSDIADEAHALKGDLDDARVAAKREGRHLLHLVDAARKAVTRLAGDRKSRSSSN